MCREMENMRKAERIEIAKRMLASGKLTYEDIAAFYRPDLRRNRSAGCTKNRITKRGTISLYTDVFLISL